MSGEIEQFTLPSAGREPLDIAASRSRRPLGRWWPAAMAGDLDRADNGSGAAGTC
jgi:hypothetical protein